MIESLQQKLPHLPPKCGVYLFKDARGAPIYIGKARELNKRVRSYFQRPTGIGNKLGAMLRNISDVEVIMTDSEVEALILEANLVKEYRPRYNVNLKDDKSFPQIRVTPEKFPQVFLTRMIRQDGSRYFGPFTDVKQTKAVLRKFKAILGIRNCRFRITDESIAQGKHQLCLDYHINICGGPCRGKVSEAEYRKNVSRLIDVLNGKTADLLDHLHRRMEELSSRKKFEEAALVRNQIRVVEGFALGQKVVSGEKVDRDLIAICHNGRDACGLVFKIRNGRLVGRAHFYLGQVVAKSEGEILESFIKQYYHRVDFIPKEILLGEWVEDSEPIQRWLMGKRKGRVILTVPRRGPKAALMRMAQRNAELLLEELKLQRLKTAFVPPILEELKKDLRLHKLPRHIEAFDISNIGGKDAVASMVSYRDGLAQKSEYRRFKIRTLSRQDDPTMMAEVIGRRYKRILEEGKDLPDLILVDGGRGQLSSALFALEQLGIENQFIIGLAKKLEEIYLPGLAEPHGIPKSSASLRLLRRIRDESHRFALDYHRKLRKKRTLVSELDQIEGISEKRKKTLLKYFGSVEKVARAPVGDLLQVEGIGSQLVRKIYGHFHPQEGFKEVF
ncbi:excinuclease ABC subunit C [candidate division KSB1 bacterium]|nr:excinuclease ABC subunit C [candidate division KSB1 bacterium]